MGGLFRALHSGPTNKSLSIRQSGVGRANFLILPTGKPVEALLMNRRQRRAEKKGRMGASLHQRLDPFLLHEKGLTAFGAGDHTEAVNWISKAIAINPHVPSFHYNLAIVLREQGRLRESAASYERAIALKPDYVNAHNNLGNVCKALGDVKGAYASLQRALELNPENADTYLSLGLLLEEIGERAKAEQYLRRCLDYDPDDSRGVAFLLAHLGVADTPLRTSLAQMLRLYDVRSRFWDHEQSYFGAALVAQAFRRHTTRVKSTILDIGCGTGLVGVQVRDCASRLDGVDISAAMLAKAEAKGLYDGLFEADFTSFMAQNADSYDAILGAASLIHFGELQSLMMIAFRCLRAGGLFIFTLFCDETNLTEGRTRADFEVASNPRLAQSGCFKHSASYIRQLAQHSGWSLRELEQVVHECDQDNNPIPGLLVVLQRD